MQGDYINRAVEVSIRIGLIVLLVAACLLILRPFLALIAWGIIIATAVYPWHLKLKKLVGGRNGLASVLSTLFLLALVLVPIVLLARSLVDGLQSVAVLFKAGMPSLPPLPEHIQRWPMIGARLQDLWEMASKNLSSVLHTFAPQIKAAIPDILMASASLGVGIIQWVLSILIAGAFLASAAKASNVAHALANHFFGDKGPEFEKLATSTVRSVTTGIIGVAFIQSFFAALGFVVAGLPGSGLWAILFLVAAMLQIGLVVLIPAVIYMFFVASTTKAAIFLAWCLVVGLMDNVLKPLLLGRGVSVPMVVVFLGAIGGFITMGAIGLFVGAILLSVGYKLITTWLQEAPSPRQDAIDYPIPIRR
jgi:predicted PurR-regulated permease PerM